MCVAPSQALVKHWPYLCVPLPWPSPSIPAERETMVWQGRTPLALTRLEIKSLCWVSANSYTPSVTTSDNLTQWRPRKERLRSFPNLFPCRARCQPPSADAGIRGDLWGDLDPLSLSLEHLVISEKKVPCWGSLSAWCGLWEGGGLTRLGLLVF